MADCVRRNRNRFQLFVHQLDNFETDYFLWLTAGGMDAAKQKTSKTEDAEMRRLEARMGGEDSEHDDEPGAEEFEG